MKNLLYFLLFLPSILFAQSQNPPSVKWKQIETEHFRVIFPDEIEKYALETALMMDTVYQYDTKIFQKNPPKKIDLYLYNRSVVSNAYAALAPKRMVWYLTPPTSPSLTLSSWNKTLGIHEFRHVTQYSFLNDGFTFLGSVFAGQYGRALFLNWSVPNWFMEGDAVFNETKYSNSGRGRMPSFTLPQRTILLNDKKFSYEKALFRSYKDYYPNHYYLGYHIVANINRNYGERIWNDILYRSTIFSFWPYSFERSVKKFTGKNIRKTYKSTYNDLDSIWTQEIENTELTDAEILNQKKKRVWTNYFDPQIISSDTLLVLKSGYDDNTSLYYLLSDGREKKIREISGDNISYSNGKVVWARYKQHIRYGEESYSDIVVYDLKTKKLKQITKKGKYFSPELSPDGKNIVAIEFGIDLVGKIVIFDLAGNIQNIFEINSDYYPMIPIWTQDGKSIIYLQTSDKGESMEILNIKNSTTKTLINPQWIKFDKPISTDEYVIFNYDYSGITNIYALSLKTKDIFQVTSRKFSANQAVIDEENNVIYFTDYNLKGFDIAKMDFIPENWQPLAKIDRKVFEYFKSPKTENEIKSINLDFTKKNISDYKPSKISQFRGLLNFHSWLPLLSLNSDLTLDYYGISGYSDNTNNTLSLIASVYGNPYKNSLMSDVWLQYKKYFPIFSLGFTSGQRGEIFDYNVPIDSLTNWYENSANMSVSVPLNLSTGIYYRALNFDAAGSFVSMTNIDENYFDDLNLPYTQLITHSTSLSFTNRRYMTYRDVLPKFGQSIRVGFREAPRIFDLHGEQLYVLSTFFLPSPIKHHGFKIQLNFEQKTRLNDNVYRFGSYVSLPRGFEPELFDKIYKGTVEYQLPLFYPDFNIPYILFVKRVRANIFYDYAQVFQNNVIDIKSSTGAELIFDFNLLRINFFTFNAGVRASYTGANEWVIQPLIMGAVIF